MAKQVIVIDDTQGTSAPAPAPLATGPRGKTAGAPAGGHGDYHQPAWDRAPKPAVTRAPAPLPSWAPAPFTGSFAPAPFTGSFAPAPYSGPSAPAPFAGPLAPAPYSGPLAPSPVPAFDRPQAVIIVGPKPLPVSLADRLPGGTGGAGTGTGAPKPSTESVGQQLARRATGGFRGLGQLAGEAGRTATAAAGNSGVAAFGGAVRAATAGLSRLGPYGMAASAGLQAVSTGVTAFHEAVGSFTRRAREIGAFDGRIAGANAAADVRRMNSDIREAQKLGDKMGKLVDQQSKAEAMWDELLLVVKGPLLDVLTFGLETGNRTLVGMLEGINKLTGGLVKGLPELIADLKKIMAGPPGGDLDKLIRDAINAPIGLAVPGAVAPARPAAPALGLPILGPP